MGHERERQHCWERSLLLGRLVAAARMEAKKHQPRTRTVNGLNLRIGKARTRLKTPFWTLSPGMIRSALELLDGSQILAHEVRAVWVRGFASTTGCLLILVYVVDIRTGEQAFLSREKARRIL